MHVHTPTKIYLSCINITHNYHSFIHSSFHSTIHLPSHLFITICLIHETPVLIPSLSSSAHFSHCNRPSNTTRRRTHDPNIRVLSSPKNIIEIFSVIWQNLKNWMFKKPNFWKLTKLSTTETRSLINLVLKNLFFWFFFRLANLTTFFDWFQAIFILFYPLFSCFQAVLDHETWVMNLKEANLYGYPIWYKLYSARDSYQMTNLMPQDWDKFVTKMTESDELFDQYYKWARTRSCIFSCNRLKIRPTCSFCFHAFFVDITGRIRQWDLRVTWNAENGWFAI